MFLALKQMAKNIPCPLCVAWCRRRGSNPFVIEVQRRQSTRYRFLPEPNREHGYRTAVDTFNRKCDRIAFPPEGDHIKQR